MPTLSYYHRHKKTLNARKRAEYAENPLPRREAHFLRTYGITLAQRDEMFAAQDFKCAICKEVKPLHIDHEHKNGRRGKHRYHGGKIRGAICNSCNCGLGYFRDAPSLLRAAIKYLEHHQEN